MREDMLDRGSRDSLSLQGTGKWTAVSSLELGMPVTLIGESGKVLPPPLFS